MTSRSTKKAATAAVKSTRSSDKPRTARLRGEPVIRHELVGACHFALIGATEASIGKKAADALAASLKHGFATCVVQRKGYVFNLSLLTVAVPEPERSVGASKKAD